MASSRSSNQIRGGDHKENRGRTELIGASRHRGSGRGPGFVSLHLRDLLHTHGRGPHMLSTNSGDAAHRCNAFGGASRLKRLAIEFGHTLEHTEFWQLEAAAMLSQLGYLSLPTQLVEKLYYGERLTPEEKTLAGGVTDLAMKLLGNIPRLEPVLQILAALRWTDEQIARLGDGTVGIGTRILGLVLEYDSHVTQGHSVDVAVQTLRRRNSRFGTRLVEQFATHLGAGSGANELRAISLRSVLPGMII